MTAAQIIDVVSFMPERTVQNGETGTDPESITEHSFFRGVAERRFASPDYTSADLGVHALEALMSRTGLRPEEIDLIVYSCMFNDTFWPGVGSIIQARVGARGATVLQVDTSCCSWLSSLQTARSFIESGQHRNVVVLTITNFISRLPEFQKSKRSWVLGDGATATLVAPGEQTILSAYERSHGEHYGLLRFEPDLASGEFKNYWERGCGPITVNFTHERLEAIRANAMSLVPEAVKTSLSRANLAPDDVSLLITHQPNAQFLEQWRSRCGISAPRVHDTLARYGNLFHGSIPVTVADALSMGKIQPGSILALGTFSNGGDMVSAMTLRWSRPNRRFTATSGGSARSRVTASGFVAKAHEGSPAMAAMDTQAAITSVLNLIQAQSAEQLTRATGPKGLVLEGNGVRVQLEEGRCNIKNGASELSVTSAEALLPLHWAVSQRLSGGSGAAVAAKKPLVQVSQARKADESGSSQNYQLDGGDLGSIDGLIRSEQTSPQDCFETMQRLTKPSYTHEEIFGQYCSLGEYIDVPYEVVFEYCANVHSLEEWTFSVRDLQHVGGGLYRGREAIQPNTEIFIRADALKGPDHGVVFYPCAWDQGYELWMRYYFTIIDATRTLRRPGTVVLWTNCKHPYYDRSVTDVPSYIAEGRARTDRYWVGDIWANFDAIHRIETGNLKRILEYRFRAGPSR
jgi:3-oxoacyl-[acyl-carrier-protein] synthase III